MTFEDLIAVADDFQKMARDAQRYRWLRDTKATIQRTKHPGERREHVEIDDGVCTRRATLDEAVDEAMAEKPWPPSRK